MYSELPNTGCNPIDFDELVDSSTPLDKVKEICSFDINCFEFYRNSDSDYFKCEPDSKHAKDARMTLYIKGKNLSIRNLSCERYIVLSRLLLEFTIIRYRYNRKK